VATANVHETGAEGTRWVSDQRAPEMSTFPGGPQPRPSIHDDLTLPAGHVALSASPPLKVGRGRDLQDFLIRCGLWAHHLRSPQGDISRFYGMPRRTSHWRTPLGGD
jgi:hypothetical protein